jgi:hypothetical protein
MGHAVRIFMKSLTPHLFSIHQSLRLTLISILLTEVYMQVSFNLKKLTSSFSNTPRCYFVVLLYESYGVRMTALLKVIAFKHTHYATALIQTEGSLLHTIKVTKAALLPFSDVAFPNIGDYR